MSFLSKIDRDWFLNLTENSHSIRVAIWHTKKLVELPHTFKLQKRLMHVYADTVKKHFSNPYLASTFTSLSF